MEQSSSGLLGACLLLLLCLLSFGEGRFPSLTRRRQGETRPAHNAGCNLVTLMSIKLVLGACVNNGQVLLDATAGYFASDGTADIPPPPPSGVLSSVPGVDPVEVLPPNLKCTWVINSGSISLENTTAVIISFYKLALGGMADPRLCYVTDLNFVFHFFTPPAWPQLVISFTFTTGSMTLEFS